MASTVWQLDDQSAALTQPGLRANFQLSNPQQGIVECQVADARLDAKLLQGARLDPATAGCQLLEAYVRQNDLIASYTLGQEQPFELKHYWRGLPSNSTSTLAALELISSMQTELLDALPRCVVGSRLAAVQSVLIWKSVEDDWQPLEIEPESSHMFAHHQVPAGVLWRFKAPQVSYLELIPPGDAQQLRLARTANGAVTSQWQIFARPLEKGVILRSRLYGVLVEQATDLDQAQHWWQALESSQLPLTV